MIIYQERMRRQQKRKSSTRRTETMKERRSICFRSHIKGGQQKGAGPQSIIMIIIMNIFNKEK